ncbi:MAG: FliM/FliN family flagellar motor switch protein [Janthinobacterium lividum]
MNSSASNDPSPPSSSSDIASACAAAVRAVQPIGWPEFDPAAGLEPPSPGATGQTADPGQMPHSGAASGGRQGSTARPDGASQAKLLQDCHPLHHVQASLQVCVGTAQVSIGTLLGASAGDVLALDRAIDEPVDLLIDGQVVARGQLVALDDRFAVRITEVALHEPWPCP